MQVFTVEFTRSSHPVPEDVTDMEGPEEAWAQPQTASVTLPGGKVLSVNCQQVCLVLSCQFATFKTQKVSFLSNYYV